jgi:hypothetical protein
MESVKQHAFKPCSLSKALRYQNREILLRFADQYGVSYEDAEELFTETKKWLWLNTQPDAPPLVVTAEMKMLDEMWHNFVLFTPQYIRYCETNFGGYVHHLPTSNAEKQRLRAEFQRDPAAASENRNRELAVQYEYIYEKLGEETLIKWQVELPYRFDRNFFLGAAKHSAPAPLGRKLRALFAQTLHQLAPSKKRARRTATATR